MSVILISLNLFVLLGQYPSIDASTPTATTTSPRPRSELKSIERMTDKERKKMRAAEVLPLLPTSHGPPGGSQDYGKQQHSHHDMMMMDSGEKEVIAHENMLHNIFLRKGTSNY